MRRRLATILTAALLGSAVLLPMTALPAVGAETAMVLAASGPSSTEGPEPMGADATENEFAPIDYEPNWTWRAGKVLLAVFVIVGAYVGLMYYLRVARPRARNRQS
jgi:hypothetical protein